VPVPESTHPARGVPTKRFKCFVYEKRTNMNSFGVAGRADMKLTWEYRVFRVKEGYVIGEVLYDEQGRIISCTGEAVQPFGETFEQLVHDLESLKAAFSKPVLTFDDIDQAAYNEWKQANAEANAKGATISHEQLIAELGLTDPPIPIDADTPTAAT